MASAVVPVRFPAPLLALIDAEASRCNATRSKIITDAVARVLTGLVDDAIPEPAPAHVAAKPRSPKPPVARAAPVDKAEAARAALASAEARVGVPKARIATPGVPVFDGGKRPAYQKGQAGRRGR